MAISNQQAYDPRWFIWTIVFLIVTGVSLASYILITSTNEANEFYFTPVIKRTIKPITGQ